MLTVYDNHILFYLLCLQTLTNELMKSGCLENHLRANYPNHVNSNLKHFETSKKFENQTKITSFATQMATLNHILEANYKISLLITIKWKES